MEHSSGVVFHFSLFEVEIFRLVVRQARWQTHAVAVLIAPTTSTRRPKQIQLLHYFQHYQNYEGILLIFV